MKVVVWSESEVVVRVRLGSKVDGGAERGMRARAERTELVAILQLDLMNQILRRRSDTERKDGGVSLLEEGTYDSEVQPEVGSSRDAALTACSRKGACDGRRRSRTRVDTQARRTTLPADSS